MSQLKKGCRQLQNRALKNSEYLVENDLNEGVHVIIRTFKTIKLNTFNMNTENFKYSRTFTIKITSKVTI